MKSLSEPITPRRPARDSVGQPARRVLHEVTDQSGDEADGERHPQPPAVGGRRAGIVQSAPEHRRKETQFHALHPTRRLAVAEPSNSYGTRTFRRRGADSC